MLVSKAFHNTEPSLKIVILLLVCLVDNFSNCLSFHIVNHKHIEVMNAHFCLLDKILNNSFLNPNTVLVISDTSIKNNVINLLSLVEVF